MEFKAPKIDSWINCKLWSSDVFCLCNRITRWVRHAKTPKSADSPCVSGHSNGPRGYSSIDIVLFAPPHVPFQGEIRVRRIPSVFFFIQKPKALDEFTRDAPYRKGNHGQLFGALNQKIMINSASRGQVICS